LNLLLSTYEAAIERNHELTRTKDDLRSANAAMEATNKELEAFSYSVSHDLRAPLRAIDGFSRNLINDYAPRLDDNGKDLLARVQKACLRMSQLIEDLLNLSRLARADMRRETLDLSALAKSVLADLGNNNPTKKIEARVQDGLSASGDPKLLRIALENLLGNAWKFSSKRPDPMIEFGMELDGNQQVFFVRDNGAGFDMTYASKLFGAFQRLHSTDEFPGTGVGLATVQRIIHRHGGRIWAEGIVNSGATFHFTV
jgi:light-regulated signal transduction histidine kinase (bacteriophytochrome)